MSEKTWWETIKAEGQELLDKLEALIREGNVRRVVIKQQNRVIAEFPLMVGVVGAVVAPVLAAIGAIVALAKDCKIEVERVDQQAVLRRFQSEELRTTKTTMLMRNLELAGVPLTAEQKEQTDALFRRESRLRTLMIIESKGEPYQTKTTPLEAQTTQRVSRLLGQDQLKVLLQTVASTRPRDAGNCSGT